MREASDRASSELRHALLPIGIFSAAVNVIMLTLPMYMLQIYDRVLTSRNVTTLIMLSLLVVVILAIGNYLNHARSRMSARLALRFQKRLGSTVFAAEIQRAQKYDQTDGDTAIDDLKQIRQFLSSNGLISLLDIPWSPLFILVLVMLHPLLGVTAAVAAMLMLFVAYVADRWSSRRIDDGSAIATEADHYLDLALRQSDVSHAMNMDIPIGRYWNQLSVKALDRLIGGSDITSTFRAFSNYIRQLAQMAMLGLGAYLAIFDIITPGAIVAGSIICSRALGPLDQALKNIRDGTDAKHAFRRLSRTADILVDQSTFSPLPRPSGALEVEEVSMLSLDRKKPPILKDISFTLEPGGSLGVVGPAGSGKSVLARLLVGTLAPSSGRVRLDGHSLHNEQNRRIGDHIGYVAQRMSLIEGSVRDNIARFRPDHIDLVMESAEKIGIHDMIERLPQGYGTLISEAAKQLRPSQMRMIEFARAAHGDPALVVLDKADAGLDNQAIQGLRRLVARCRQDDRILVVASDRPTVVRDLDRVMVLWNGSMEGIMDPDRLLSHMEQLKVGSDNRA